MTKRRATVNLHMTHLPVECERCETVADARTVMAKHGIRHLPVMNGLHLIGVISERRLLELQLARGDTLEQQQLDEICERDVLTVGPLTPVAEVVEQMLARRIGSAVVVDGEYVVGVFTTSDALRLLMQLTS